MIQKKTQDLKKLIDCFEYLKRYYIDIVDALHAMLELLLLQKKYQVFETYHTEEIEEIIRYQMIEVLGMRDSIVLQANLKFHKLEKFFTNVAIDFNLIEEFFYIVTQQKTSNKLYYYSTPLQINHLLVGLLEIQEDEEVYNPCYGMGSIFLSLAQVQKKIKLYGEELDFRLSSIALLILKICEIDASQLYVNDLLKTPRFIFRNKIQIFDKILCNPPLYAHMGTEFLKKDQRFNDIGAIAKHYPELVFLIHSLTHLKKRGVFIVRNQVLQKSSLEARIREKLCREKMIKAIIELPKNLFPHQNNDFSILVIEPNSNEILHIDINHTFFYEREGKYNRLKNIEKILEIFREHKEGQFCKITKITKITSGDLRASHFVTKQEQPEGNSIKQLGFSVMRGQRVYGGKKDTDIVFFDVGIADFKVLGFSYQFENRKNKGDKNKIKKYQLRPYDVLLSLRGTVPKITILGQFMQTCVANAGVVVLRHQDKQKALALYCYLFMSDGERKLREVYEKSSDGVLNTDYLLDLVLPKDYEKNTQKVLNKILELSKNLEFLEQEIEKLKSGK